VEAVTDKAAHGESNVEAMVRYQACSDVKCLPPVKKTVSSPISFVDGSPAQNMAVPQGYVLVGAAATAAASAPVGGTAASSAAST
jgi:hypothetical protein